ncbi:MAG: MFS transporter [Chloroflexota bacterium]
MNKRAFVSLSVATFVTMMGMSIISPLMALYAQSLGATGFQLSLMYSAFALSRSLIQPFTGWYSDHKGRKNLMVIGLAGFTVVSVGYALAANMYQLTIVRLLHGLASAMVIPIAQAYIGDICPRGKENLYMGIFMMSMYVGMGTGPLLGGTLSDAFGTMDPAFYVMASLAFGGLILMIQYVPHTEARIIARKSRTPMRVMLRDNRVKAVALYLGSRGILRQGIVAFLPLFATQVMGKSLTLASVASSVYIMTEAFGQGIVGPITNYFSKKALMVIAAVVASALALFVGSSRSFFGLLALLVPIALLTALGRIPALAYSVETGNRHGRMGVGMGINNAAQDLGHFFGPMAFGWAMDKFGIGSIFTVGGIICLVTVPLMSYWLFQKEPETETVPETAKTEPARSQE